MSLIKPEERHQQAINKDKLFFLVTMISSYRCVGLVIDFM